MYTQIVTVRIKPERRREFVDAMLSHAQDSVEDDPGCIRFDMLSDEADPDAFHLYEVYRDKDALDAHNRRPSHVRTVETVRECVSVPSVVSRSNSIFPKDDAWV